MSSYALVKQHEKFSAVMGARFNDPQYCDLRVTTDDGVLFHCSKYALRCGSDVFHKMLMHEMKESISGEVRISGAAAQHIEVVLRFMHCGVWEPNSRCILPVMSIATRYEVTSLLSVCGAFRDKHFSVNATNCFCILKQIYEFPEISQSTKQQCKDAVLRTFAAPERDKIAQKDFLDLSYEAILDTLKMAVAHFFLHEQLPLGYINFVSALLEWLDYDKKSRGPKAITLLLSLEFEALGIQGISKITKEMKKKKIEARNDPAVSERIVDAISSENNYPQKYTSSENFSCKPGKWSFVCKGKSSGMSKKGMAAMATFNFEDTTEVFLHIPHNGQPLCGIYTVCKENFIHFLILVGQDGQDNVDLKTYDFGRGRNVSSGKKCCDFWLHSENKQSLRFDTLTHMDRVLPYVHPLAVEADEFRPTSSEASASVLERPNIFTSEE